MTEKQFGVLVHGAGWVATPHTPPANLELLVPLAEEFGKYNL
jgi:hypothetical protein